jgi:hypothetical protein
MKIGDVEDLSIQTLEALTVEEAMALKKTEKMFRKLDCNQRLPGEHSGVQAKPTLSRGHFAWKLPFLPEHTVNDKKIADLLCDKDMLVIDEFIERCRSNLDRKLMPGKINID